MKQMIIPILVSTLLAALGNFIDFILRKKEKKLIRKYLEKFLVAVEQVNYYDLATIVANNLLKGCHHVFGLDGPFAPRLLQVIHISFSLSAAALFIGSWGTVLSVSIAVWVVFNITLIATLMVYGWKRVGVLMKKNTFWFWYIAAIVTFLIFDYLIDLYIIKLPEFISLYSAYFDTDKPYVFHWFMSVVQMITILAVNLLFDFLTVLITIHVVRKISLGPKFSNFGWIAFDIVAAYLLMVFTFYILIALGNLVVKESFWPLLENIASWGGKGSLVPYDYLELAGLVLIVPLMLLLDLINSNFVPDLFCGITNLHYWTNTFQHSVAAKAFEPDKYLVTVQAFLGSLMGVTFYSATTLIPTIFFLITISICIIFKPAISLAFKVSRYASTSMLEKDDVPVFLAMGMFLGLFVLLARIISLSFF